MKQAPFLKKGDSVCILSTARKAAATDLEAAITVFKSWGLNVQLGSSIGKEDHQFAGSDEIRASDLQRAVNDVDIAAIICARGGYGTVRIIDRIDFSSFKNNPKWFVGFSDATVIHSHLQALYQIPSIHAVMPTIFRFDEAGLRAQATMHQAMFGQGLRYEISQQSVNYRIGQAEGILVGGNLSILYSLLGSASDINTDRKILFIEDLDEYLYHLDRMMISLKRAGKLSHLTGLLVGGMVEMNDNDTPFGKTAEEIIWEHVKEYSYPVSFNFPAGHIRDNRALYLGKLARLSVSSKDTVLEYR